MKLQITIANYNNARQLLDAGEPFTHVISINDPGSFPPPSLMRHRASNMTLYFHDIDTPPPNKGVLIPPSREDVRRILRFAEGMATRSSPVNLLVHCSAGISRSSAAALCVLAALVDMTDDELMDELLAIKRMVVPNQLMVHYLDQETAAGGELLAAYRRKFKSGNSIWVP